ncbi:gluconokinase [Exiguobacterium chiriqhucha]|uniref:gluconokinase n=1 Tax=Exiguobacterium chiriqhucha TaxID=1385984 RepID=UPI00191A3DAD|nr:gluconokinase [Exiguobacterium chiriqhucha]
MCVYTIGVDIGTTSTKAVLFHNQQQLAVHNVLYPLLTPDTETAEQDPVVIYGAVLEAISAVRAKADGPVRFASFSSAMHSLIALDASGRPLTHSITWADSRANPYTQEIKRNFDASALHMRTGTPVHPMAPLSKLRWLKAEHPDVFNHAAKFVSIKEYVFYRLTGRFVIDHSIASATGLFNLKNCDWDAEALDVAGVTPEQLPDLVPTTEILTLKPDVIETLGWDFPLVIGASDGVLSNLGVGAFEQGVVAVTIGTSGAIRTVVREPVEDPKGRIFCYALTDKHWVIGGPVNNGGIILRWLRDEFAASEVETAKRLGMDAYDVLTRIAETVKPGSDGLLFHPYLMGERAPLWDSNARGSFFGLSIHHKREHFIRSVLEGVIFNLYTVMLALDELTGAPNRIHATGGFAQSSLWRQMMADIFDTPVVVPESHESSCLGAVMLGEYAFGDIDDFTAVPQVTHEHAPNHKATTIYRELLPIYIRLSRHLAEEYEAIAAFQRKYV